MTSIYRNAAMRNGINKQRLSECTTKEGHRFTGEYEFEDGTVWAWVIDDNGNEYQVDPDVDEPVVKPMFTIRQFIGTWTGDEVKRYLATQSM